MSGGRPGGFQIDDTYPVMLIDDHPMFIEALQMALRPMLRRPVFSVAGSLREAEALLDAVNAKLILLDLQLPDAGGLEGATRLKAKLGAAARIVIVSGRDDPSTVSLARAVGVAGFISKVQPLAAIQDNLRIVLEGGTVFPSQSQDAQALALAALSPAQARILAAAATGKLNKQIAFDMALSETTVKSHMSAIMKKLGVTNRTQAILAIRPTGAPD